MTDNTKFKEEAGELLERVILFRIKYLGEKVKEPLATSPSALFESQLRIMLMVARTAEENKTQQTIDGQI